MKIAEREKKNSRKKLQAFLILCVYFEVFSSLNKTIIKCQRLRKNLKIILK